MKIAYVNDQVFPNSDTDAEQIMLSNTALAELEDVEPVLFLAAKWGKEPASMKEIEDYYHVKPKFKIHQLKSLFPSVRLFEKWAHGFVSCFNRELRACDLAYSRNVPTVIMLLLFTSLPVVYETYRAWPNQHPFFKLLFRFLGKRKRLVGAIFHSDYAAESYRRIGFPAEKITVAHNGYHTSSIEPRMDKSEARKALGIGDWPGRVVSYAGNISVKKGIGTLLDMAERMEDTLFLLVGSKSEGEIEKRAAVMKNVRVYPWQSFKNVLPYLYAADMLLIPPVSKPLAKYGNTVLPIKTFLYMATGRPIFGPANPDLLEILEDGKNSVLVGSDSVDESVSRLGRALNDEKTLEKLSDRILEDSKSFTYHNRALHVEAFLRNRVRGE